VARRKLRPVPTSAALAQPRLFKAWHHGSDLDDSAAYPRTLLNVFTAGRKQAHLFMLHREQILAEVGLYFLGAQTPIAVRRSAAKQLFNALDNDGSLRAWEHNHKCQNTRPWDGPMPPFDARKKMKEDEGLSRQAKIDWA
jgi:hypothetical protein